MTIDLSQEELILINSVLSQVQLIYKDSKRVNALIDKLDTYIEKPQPTDITKQPVEGEVVS